MCKIQIGETKVLFDGKPRARGLAGTVGVGARRYRAPLYRLECRVYFSSRDSTLSYVLTRRRGGGDTASRARWHGARRSRARRRRARRRASRREASRRRPGVGRRARREASRRRRRGVRRRGGPRFQTSFMALGSCSTAASCSRLVDENGPGDPLLRQEVEGGHRLGSFSYHTGPSEPQLTSSGQSCTRDPAPAKQWQRNVTGCPGSKGPISLPKISGRVLTLSGCARKTAPERRRIRTRYLSAQAT